jgi:hypothetical protein
MGRIHCSGGSYLTSQTSIPCSVGAGWYGQGNRLSVDDINSLQSAQTLPEGQSQVSFWYGESNAMAAFGIICIVDAYEFMHGCTVSCTLSQAH